MRAFFLRLGKDRRGTAIVELGLAAPVLACIVIGMTDIANVFSRKLALEQGAQRAIEKQMQTTGADTPEGTIKSEAALQANVDPAEVTVSYLLFCNNVAKTPYSADCDPGEVEVRYLSVTVTDIYDPIFPIKYGPVRTDGTYVVSATAGMRTQ